MFTKIT